MAVAEMDPLHVGAFAPLDYFGRIVVQDEVLTAQAPRLASGQR